MEWYVVLMTIIAVIGFFSFALLIDKIRLGYEIGKQFSYLHVERTAAEVIQTLVKGNNISKPLRNFAEMVPVFVFLMGKDKALTEISIILMKIRRAEDPVLEIPFASISYGRQENTFVLTLQEKGHAKEYAIDLLLLGRVTPLPETKK